MLTLKEFLKADTTTVSNLLLQYYQKIGMSNDEFILFLHLLRFEQEGNSFPELGVLEETTGMSIDHIIQVLQSSVDKGFISIETQINSSGQSEDRYDLTLFYDRLGHYLEQLEKKQLEVSSEKKVTNLYQTFEVEFGRPLSPIEFETIQSWLTVDHYGTELIELALREAVLNQAYSLKYIDRILLAWERKNLRTKQDVQVDQKKRTNQIESKAKNEEEEKLPFIPLHNWLNPNEK
ncbi:DnaD domain protein [Vagococcus carniphilus]|uniref:DNA replication protein DnaD n=1 Tax=Vagococcus carniphilus TaxID=218144 RepID=A0A430AWE4_9ENTE|nr:DnaD domain protein [Vagococcus carniphilus]QNN72187.1 DnaD domain protein [Vagococcus carniphilus]RSU12368.1 DNA replication protein DnaD [Vagococcus carniphilus]